MTICEPGVLITLEAFKVWYCFWVLKTFVICDLGVMQKHLENQIRTNQVWTERPRQLIFLVQTHMTHPNKSTNIHSSLHSGHPAVAAALCECPLPRVWDAGEVTPLAETRVARVLLCRLSQLLASSTRPSRCASFLCVDIFFPSAGASHGRSLLRPLVGAKIGGAPGESILRRISFTVCLSHWLHRQSLESKAGLGGKDEG